MTEQTAAHTPGEWRYDIQYGPEGEAAYAWVYDAAGQMVGTMRTHQATEIVGTMNGNVELIDVAKRMLDYRNRDYVPSSLFSKLDAAISRAEGRAEPKAGA